MSDLPDPPAPFFQPAENDLGTEGYAEATDAVQSARDLVAQAAPGLEGRPDTVSWRAPAGSDPASLRDWYAQRAAAAGWKPVDGFGGRLRQNSDGFAFTAPGRAFALVWLKRPVGTTGERAIAVVRYGGGR